ncbi:hypothetical protein ACNKHW_02255 [Shigella flexneri]
MTAIPAVIITRFLHHLDRCNEILARVNTIHNLRYYQRLMAGLREAIEEAVWKHLPLNFISGRERGDAPPLVIIM